MAHEHSPEPSNTVSFNKYAADSKKRVPTGKVVEDWYIARFRNPEAEDINRFAVDVLMRIVKVTDLKDGARKVYGIPVSNDGQTEVSEEDAVAINRDAFLIEGSSERGYLLDAFNRDPRTLGSLATGVAIGA